jgi:hypothetical protein
VAQFGLQALLRAEKTSPGEGTLSASRKTAVCFCASVMGGGAESMDWAALQPMAISTISAMTPKCLPVSMISGYTSYPLVASFIAPFLRDLKNQAKSNPS